MSGTKLGCFQFGCQADADVAAYDTMFSVNIGFCEDHAEEWEDTDHVELRYDDTENGQ